MEQFLISLGNILALGEKYGLSVIMLAFACAGGYLGIRWVAKKFDILLDDLRHMKNNIPDVITETVEKFLYVSEEISSLMEIIRVYFHADWVHFWMFHNGTWTIGEKRIPFVHLALISEAINSVDGVQPVLAEFSQYPLVSISKTIQYFLNHELLIYRSSIDPTIKQTEAEWEDESVARGVDNAVTTRMFQIGATGQYLFPIVDRKGYIIGMLEMAFLVDPVLDSNQRNAFKIYGRRIGVVVSNYGSSELKTVPIKYPKTKE